MRDILAVGEMGFEVAKFGAHWLEGWVVGWPFMEGLAAGRGGGGEGWGVWSGGDDARIAFSWLGLPSTSGSRGDRRVEGRDHEHDSNAHDDEDRDGDGEENCKVLWQDRKIHSAGVTAIVPLPLADEAGQLVVTGSYDESLRLLRLPALRNGVMMGKRQVLAEVGLGGGVWRVKIMGMKQENGTGGVRCVFSS